MIVRKENESIFDIVGRAAPPTPTRLRNCRSKSKRNQPKEPRHCEPVRAWQSPGGFANRAIVQEIATSPVGSSQ